MPCKIPPVSMRRLVVCRAHADKPISAKTCGMILEIIPISISGEINVDTGLVDAIMKSERVCNGDILVVTQKAVSKAEGRMVHLDSIEPSLLARGISGEYDKDPRVVELVLRQCRRILRMEYGIIITEMRTGHVCANSGVDTSNVPEGYALLLPSDCDVSAELIRQTLQDEYDIQVGVIISDTVGRPFRNGQVDIALGCSGISPLLDYTGKPDMYGKILKVTMPAVADQLASAAELAMTKTGGNPAAIIRGADNLHGPGSGQDLIRVQRDLFR